MKNPTNPYTRFRKLLHPYTQTDQPCVRSCCLYEAQCKALGQLAVQFSSENQIFPFTFTYTKVNIANENPRVTETEHFTMRLQNEDKSIAHLKLGRLFNSPDERVFAWKVVKTKAMLFCLAFTLQWSHHEWRSCAWSWVVLGNCISV